MLPFLKKKDASVAGLIIKTRAPDAAPKADENEEKDDSSAAIEACASELVRAIHSRDAKAVAAALKDAFDILEATEEETPEESEAPSPHSYDAQNIKAAQES